MVSFLADKSLKITKPAFHRKVKNKPLEHPNLTAFLILTPNLLIFEFDLTFATTLQEKTFIEIGWESLVLSCTQIDAWTSLWLFRRFHGNQYIWYAILASFEVLQAMQGKARSIIIAIICLSAYRSYVLIEIYKLEFE